MLCIQNKNYINRTGQKHMDKEIKSCFVNTVYSLLSRPVKVGVRFTLKNFRTGRRDGISPCVSDCIHIISECEDIAHARPDSFEVQSIIIS